MKIFQKIQWRRAFSAFLALILLLSGGNCGVIAVYAAGSDDPTLCEHHKEHSYEVCGYLEAAEDSSCSYVCPECAQAELQKACTCGAEGNAGGSIIHAESCNLYVASAYADETDGAAVTGFTAKLYTGQTNSGTSVELTESNTGSATLSLSRNLLQISWTYDLSEPHKLEIAVPAGLYIEDYTGKGDQSSLSGITVIFSKDQNQGTGSYSNENTGTLSYSYAPSDGTNPTGTRTINLNVYVSIDQTVWDKTAQSTVSIGGSSPAVSISAGAITKTVQSVYVSAGEARPMTSYIDNEAPVEAGKDGQKTFQLRFLTGGGRYEETVAWKSITVRFSARVTKSSTVPLGTTVPLGFSQYGLNFTYAEGGYQFTYNAQTGEAEVIYTDIRQKGSTVNTLQMGYPLLDLSGQALAALGNNDEITVTYTTSFTSYYGSTYTVANNAAKAVTVKGTTAEINLSAAQYTPSAIWAYNKNGQYLSCLGRASFANAAFGDAYDAEITVTFGDDLRVQYYRVPMYGKAVVTVILGKMDTDTGAAINGSDKEVILELETQSASAGAPLSVLMLSDCDDSYYIKEIRYSQKKILANTTYGSGYSNNAAGGIWGNLYSGGTGSYDISMSLSYYTTQRAENSEDTRTPQTKTVTKTIQQVSSDTAVGHHAYIADGLSSTKMNIGDSATLDFKITVHAYPYGGSNYMANPVIFAILPTGISFNAVKYSLDGQTWYTMVRDSIVCTEDVRSGDNLWTIDIDLTNQGGLGGYQLDGTGALVQTNTELYISMEIAAEDVVPQTYTLHERLLISSKVGQKDYAKCLAGGTEASSTYTSTIPTGASLVYGAPPSGDLVVVNPNNNLTVVTEIKKDGADFIYGNGEDHAVYVKNGDIVFYQMTVKNNTASVVGSDETAIYIPVLHKGIVLNGAMNGAKPNFDAVLTGPVEVTSAEVVWEVRYCTEQAVYEGFLAENGVAFTDFDGYQWKTESEISDWSQVTMIKAVVKEGTNYPKNAKSTLLVTFEIGNCKPSSKAIWNSIIWTKKDSEGVEITDGVDHHTVFTRLQADITNFKYEMTVTLKAGASAQEELKLDELREVNVAELTVTGVTAYNMTLKSPGQVSDSQITDIYQRDETFAVELSTGGATWCDLSTPTEESMSFSEAQNTLTARVTYCTMIDGITPRYLVVQLEGTANGEDKALITLTINLRRIIKVKEENSILSGKHYNGIGIKNNSISVSQDGAFTIQISLGENFASQGENNPKVTLDNNAELKGANLLLIDQSNGTPKYYKQEASGGEIALNSFEGYGTTIGHFTMSNGKKALLLIVDLSGSEIAAQDYKCKIDISSDDSADTGTEFDVKVTAKGNAVLTTNDANGFTMENSTGRPAAIKFTLYKDEVPVSFPRGAVLKAGNVSYMHSADGTYILIPMGISGGSVQVQLEMPYEKLDPGKYTLVATGYVSATSNGSAPLGGTTCGEQTMEITIEKEALSAIRVTMTDRLLTAEKLKTGVSATVSIQNVSSWTCTLTGVNGTRYNTTIGNASIIIPSDLPAGEYILTVTGSGAESSIHFIVVGED